MDREAREDRIEVQKLMVYIYIYSHLIVWDCCFILID